MADTIRVAVTGAAGQVAYAMLARLASGEVFGPDTQGDPATAGDPRPRRTARTPAKASRWNWTTAAFPTLADVIVTDDPNKAFAGRQLGAPGRLLPAQAGHGAQGPARHQRQDLRRPGQGAGEERGLDVRILVVGNPCNTNCLVAYSNGRDIPAERWTAMTRLDHNRARTALAKKAGVANADVTCVTIWGNHSNTQYPDFTNAKIKGKPATGGHHRSQLAGERRSCRRCQNRGAAVIKARGQSVRRCRRPTAPSITSRAC